MDAGRLIYTVLQAIEFRDNRFHRDPGSLFLLIQEVHAVGYQSVGLFCLSVHVKVHRAQDDCTADDVLYIPGHQQHAHTVCHNAKHDGVI